MKDKARIFDRRPHPQPVANNKKTVLILAAGRFQTYAIKEAKALGYNVIATDMNPFAEGLNHADYSYVVSSRNVHALLEVIRYHSKFQKVDGILTVGTDVSNVVAALQDELNLPGIGLENANAATNKAIMRERFKKFGVPSPEFRKVSTLDQALDAAEELGFPVVLKPTDCMGARGVSRVDSRSFLPHAFFGAFSITQDSVILVEKYMEGPELSIDALVVDGKIHYLVVGDRIIKFPPYFVEIGHSVPSLLPEKIIQEAKDVMSAGIRALGINIGAAKGDIKITPDGIMIGEIAARLSGGFMSSHTLPLSTGINAIEGAIKIAVGDPVNLEKKFEKGAAERAFLPKFGRLISVHGVKEALEIEGVADIFIDIRPGDMIRPLNSNMQKAGHVITVGHDRFEAEATAEKVLKTVKFRVSTP